MSKCIVVVDQDLPVGLKANISAVLCMSLGKGVPDLVGPPVRTGDDVEFPGITTVPVPILQAPGGDLKTLYEKTAGEAFVVAFTDAAMETKDYDSYTRRMSEKTVGDLVVYGLLIHGAKKMVNKLSGSLALLK
ncbi:DUF2000 domain-containing protein [Caenispirillum salinarum]|uniref:DUF2000 domain-containing protein n=1 Tax=Caenispirillum salinarum TaxID=859058 RepID=UPI00385014E7